MLQDDIQNLQAVRAISQDSFDIPNASASGSVVHIDSHLDLLSHAPVVLESDIVQSFADALHISCSSSAVPFVEGADLSPNT
jgi:hypothetical protein